MHITQKYRRLSSLLLLVLLAFSGVTSAQLNEHCIVSVLNRNVQVKADGTWVLPNIPANFGPVRARATCVENGITRSGQSALFAIPASGSVDVPPIVLGPVNPIPNQVTVSASTTTLTQAGQTTPLTVTGKYADGTTQDITPSSTGTQYLISNPTLATVSADGVVTARQSGTVIVQAINEGTQGLLQLSVALSQDTDGDGILDDIELREGLNPNNPADALDDFDRDGLTNRDELQRGTAIRNPDTDGDDLKDGEEVRLGTSPLLSDTDGDGVADGVEVASGSDPLDPTSVDLARALRRITVTPTNFIINVSSVDLLAYQQLTVTGELNTGATINLTSRARGTNYASSDLQVCNFGAEDGRVFGGSDGSCTITVTNNGFTATANGVVRTFTPLALSFIAIPGFANNVDVSGNYAYVAAGFTGLQVVDVANRANPQVVASLDTPGNANDVVVVGNFAYVADDSFGLQIIDISNPLAPSLVGTLDTAGIAWDVVVRGDYAFVADGTGGLKIIDVSTSDAPSLAGSLALPGIAKGVDVDLTRNLAVVVGTAGVQVVNIADPTAPALLGAAAGGDVRDVVINGNFAFLADLSRSFTVVDITNPATPVVGASTNPNLGGRLQDVALSGSFGLGADVVFVNGVPIIDINDPALPQPRAILDFSQFRDDNATGIAVDGVFVYLTAERGISENGVIGDTRLYIGQYRPQEDRGGIPPTASITTPAGDGTVIQGQQLAIAAQATDDVAVAAVTFNINGVDVFTDTTSPYETSYTVPDNATNLTIVAKALDLGNNLASSTPINLTAIPDPLTTAMGRVVNRDGIPQAGATVLCSGVAATSNQDGRFAIAGLGTISGPIGCTASLLDNEGRTLSGDSSQVSPVRGGATDVGDIVLSDVRFETDLGVNLNQSDDVFTYIPFTNGFSFPFYGITYAGVYVNSNGRLTFSFGDGTYVPNLAEFNEQPQVAAFFDDLYPPVPGGGVFVRQDADRFVVTWNRMPIYSARFSNQFNTIQAILFSDGRVQMAYNGISATNSGTIVGLSPGNAPAPSETDFSLSAPFTVSAPQGIYEWFGSGGGGDPFDLDAHFLIFTPTPSNGYIVDVRPLQF